MRIVLLGAPGSGKGTQAQKLQAKYEVPQVSSGDLLREAVGRGTELGLKAKAVMDAGQLVSDDIVLGLIRDRLSRPDAVNGFILDGFPRNIEQANRLTEMLDALGQPIEAVLLLDVQRDTLVKRLAGRRICPKCGTVYNVNTMAPGATGCAKDGAELQQRPDDNEEVIAKRLEVYENQTRPLVEHYSKQGLLRVIAGEGELDEVFERMESAALANEIPPGKVSVREVAPKSRNRKAAVRSTKAPVKASPKKASKKKSASKKPAAKNAAAKKSPKKSAKSKSASSGRKVASKAASQKKSAKNLKRKSGKKVAKNSSKKAGRKVAKKPSAKSRTKARAKK
jgi:adenylate kinase